VIGANRKPLLSISYSQIMKKSAIVNAKEKRNLKKEKNNKYPVLSDDFKSRKEVVRQLFEETIQTVANGSLSSRCTRPKLASETFFEINVPCGQFRRVNSIDRGKSFFSGLPISFLKDICNEQNSVLGCAHGKRSQPHPIL